MKYGPHTPDVEQVLEFIRSGNLLSGATAGFLMESDDLVVINHPEDLKLILQHDGSLEYPSDERYFTWKGIRQNETSPFFCLDVSVLHNLQDAENIKSQLGEQISQMVESRLHDCFSEEIYGLVIDDFDMIALKRMTWGLRSGFFERLFFLYQQGVFPCGWEGFYPEGKMIVFDPKGRPLYFDNDLNWTRS